MNEYLTGNAEALQARGVEKVYLAGPMTGRVDWNEPAFFAAESRLRDLGFDVVNPFAVDASVGHDVHADGPQTHAEYMSRDVPEALACDAVVVIPGWSGSKGARIETAVFAACKGEDLVLDLDLDGAFQPYLRPGIEPLVPEDVEIDLATGEPVFYGAKVVETNGPDACCGDPGDCSGPCPCDEVESDVVGRVAQYVTIDESHTIDPEAIRSFVLSISTTDVEPEVETVCQEADRLVSHDRNEDYGHPLDDFSKVVGMAKALWGRGPETAEEHAVYMCLVKIAREANRPKRDNRVDACGYMKTLDMVIAERERRAAL